MARFSICLALLGTALVASPLVIAAPLERRTTATIPGYVMDYAPLVWLHSEDPFLPSDLGAQLLHTAPEVTFAPVLGAPSPLTLDNLDALNSMGGSKVFLTAREDVSSLPSWLFGVAPDASGKTNGAVSTVVIVNDHGSGNVDAFYMYFYAYNYGGIFLWQQVDDHVGDWEHTMVRFSNGVPTAVWFSQHANGEAFTYDAVEKRGLRPVVYSANGSHANYATSGTHDHLIPDVNLFYGILNDYCDQGKLWDPVLSAYFYSFDASTKAFTPAAGYNPLGLVNFVGQWGDQQYPDSDKRQEKIFGLEVSAKYTNGPTGPEDKQLNRTNVCPDDGILCIVRPFLTP
ncbi:MAG: hypothetical protein M1838_000561 [Thelocarpon superellum]|nr:MAG: hypothetical protein M1838_000561 [Thelocarpon superellum]